MWCTGEVLVPEELADRAAAYPDRRAVVVDGGATMTYRQWDERANAVARGLIARGVEQGDRVAMLLTTYEACDAAAAYVGILRAGAAAVPINTRWAAREVEHAIGDCGARVVIASYEAGHAIPAGRPVMSVDDLVAHQPSDPLDVELDPDELSEILYTSGTTGRPRGVAASHRSASRHDLRPLRDGGALLHSIPLATFTGLHGGLLTPLHLAATALVLPRFDTTRFAELVELERPAWLLLVPAQILLLLESGSLQHRDTSSVAIVMFGGSPTPPTAVARLAEAFPSAALVQGYGLTEGGGSVCVLPPDEATRRPGSVGRPVAGVGLRIVDPDDPSLDRPAGEVGEVLLQLPHEERRYWGDDEATADAWRDGWLRTGDLGRVDDDGFLYVVDRRKDVIVRGGYNIASVAVEAAIHGVLPDLVECAVVGVPHDVLGEDVAAVVRMRDGAPPPTLEHLRAALAEHLADYEQPRHLLPVRDPLPRNAAGKTDKAAVRRLALEAM